MRGISERCINLTINLLTLNPELDMLFRLYIRSNRMATPTLVERFRNLVGDIRSLADAGMLFTSDNREEQIAIANASLRLQVAADHTTDALDKGFPASKTSTAPETTAERFQIRKIDGLWRVIDHRRSPYSSWIASCENRDDAEVVKEAFERLQGK
jgi:predicted methyltransferase